MEEAYYNPYNPVHTSEFPPQDRLATTDLEKPTQDLKRPLSSSAADRALLNAHQGFSSGGSIVSEKHKNHSTGTKTTVWVFTWSEVVNYVLQTVTLIAAVVFGVWAIRTYDAARDSLAIASTANDLSTHAVALAAAANELSSKVLAQNVVANSLALLTFCASIQAGPSSNFTNPCSSITPSLWSLVIRGLAPDTGTTPTPLPTITVTSTISTPNTPTIVTLSSSTQTIITTNTLSLSWHFTTRPTSTATTATLTTTSTLPATTISRPAKQKSALHFSAIVGIIVAVGVLFVAVGAFLVGKKRLRLSVTRVG